jgi:hypothetical protein
VFAINSNTFAYYDEETGERQTGEYEKYDDFAFKSLFDIRYTPAKDKETNITGDPDVIVAAGL